MAPQPRFTDPACRGLNIDTFYNHTYEERDERAAKVQKIAELTGYAPRSITEVSNGNYAGRVKEEDANYLREILEYYGVTTNVELSGEMRKEYRKMCSGCPDFEACFDWGLNHEKHGWWGGTTGGERDQLRKKMNIIVEEPGSGMYQLFGTTSETRSFGLRDE
ncbi:MAG: hypothetical protein EB168_05495 [Euryarchaeota archaeon]|nr:hypothetical protein [Euryarchaeota archaeon]